MSALQKLNKYLSNFIDVKFALIFICLAAFLYFFNVFYIAITDSQGLIYSSFLADHLDYISWIRNTFLHTSKFIARILGTDCYVFDDYTIKSYSGAFVTIAFPCLGYGVTSVWLAFIIAQSDSWKRKVIWCFTGTIALWFINCCRIALLLVAYDKRWQVNKFADHHTLFNIATYILIFMMMYLYYRKNKIISTKGLSKKIGNTGHQPFAFVTESGTMHQ